MLVFIRLRLFTLSAFSLYWRKQPIYIKPFDLQHFHYFSDIRHILTYSICKDVVDWSKTIEDIDYLVGVLNIFTHIVQIFSKTLQIFTKPLQKITKPIQNFTKPILIFDLLIEIRVFDIFYFCGQQNWSSGFVSHKTWRVL